VRRLDCVLAGTKEKVLGKQAAAKEQSEGRAEQEAIRKLVRSLPATLFKDRDEFERALDGAAKKTGLKLPVPARSASSATRSTSTATSTTTPRRVRWRRSKLTSGIRPVPMRQAPSVFRPRDLDQVGLSRSAKPSSA
jgi:hypothetical protein